MGAVGGGGKGKGGGGSLISETGGTIEKGSKIQITENPLLFPKKIAVGIHRFRHCSLFTQACTSQIKSYKNLMA